MRRVRTPVVLAALVAVCALCAPASAWAAPDPFFGTWADHMSLDRTQSRVEMDRQAAAGIGLIRLHVFWDRVETAPNVYFWARLDEVVEDATDRGLQILPVLLSTPEFYVTKPPDAKANLQFPPDDPALLGRFAQKLIQRYGPAGSFWCPTFSLCRTPYAPIAAWQVWNEPNYPSWWKGTPNAGEYAALLHVVNLHVKAVDPTAEVVLAGLAPSENVIPYLEELYAANAQVDFDTLAVHAYGDNLSEAIGVVRHVREVADAQNDLTTPIWVTEYGWASAGARSAQVTTLDCQAALIHAEATRWSQLRDELKLRGASQFQWRDVPTTSASWPFHAGLNPVDPAAPAKPSLQAYADAIAGRPPAPGHTTKEACTPAPPAIAGPADGAHLNVGSLTLVGSAEANRFVEVFDRGTSLGQVPVDARGGWSKALTGLPDGAHVYTARTIGPGEDPSDASSPVLVQVDTVAPRTPAIAAPADGEYLRAASVTLAGAAEPGTLVSVLEAGAVVGAATADAKGNWSQTVSGVGDGPHTYTATATDAAGNVSPASSPRSITVDTRPTSPPLSPPTVVARRYTANLRAMLAGAAGELWRIRARGLRRRGGLAVVGRGLAAGARLSVRMSAGPTLLASASCSASRAGRCTMTLRLTPRGRRLLTRVRGLTVRLTAQLRNPGPVVTRRVVLRP